MHTAKVTREFRDKCYELAELSEIPEIKSRLWTLGEKYDRLLGEIVSVDPSPSPVSGSIDASGTIEGADEKRHPHIIAEVQAASSPSAVALVPDPLSTPTYLRLAQLADLNPRLEITYEPSAAQRTIQQKENQSSPVEDWTDGGSA